MDNEVIISPIEGTGYIVEIAQDPSDYSVELTPEGPAEYAVVITNVEGTENIEVVSVEESQSVEILPQDISGEIIELQPVVHDGYNIELFVGIDGGRISLTGHVAGEEQAGVVDTILQTSAISDQATEDPQLADILLMYDNSLGKLAKTDLSGLKTLLNEDTFLQSIDDNLNGTFDFVLNSGDEINLNLNNYLGDDNVQSDWEETDNQSDAFILNKPDLSAIDHGGLNGLADDDHTQYHTDARALAWLGTRSTDDLPEGSNNSYFPGFDTLLNDYGVDLSEYLTDAPSDGRVYGRKDNSWFDIINYLTWQSSVLTSTYVGATNTSSYEIVWQDVVPIANSAERIIEFRANGAYTGELSAAGNTLSIKMLWSDGANNLNTLGEVVINNESQYVTNQGFDVCVYITIRTEGSEGAMSSYMRVTAKDNTYEDFRETVKIDLTTINKLGFKVKSETLDKPDWQVNQAFLKANN